MPKPGMVGMIPLQLEKVSAGHRYKVLCVNCLCHIRYSGFLDTVRQSVREGLELRTERLLRISGQGVNDKVTGS
ncbi:hypothetical protein PoB_006520100 [Plakobranchus ocellatus]|uniref:Uncharacterized protein n=1 Tax=Plakobranchus ocellatus TaxID=259542 RepID=A0AAV4D3C3_9GAST|nr:hypothetical protein PoB_006520100 [Plakobranchus ocellatus]